MLIQNLLDFFADVFANVVSSLPPLPYEVAYLVSELVNGSQWLGERVGILGVVVPFSTLTLLVLIWVNLVGFWVTITTVRAVAWAFGR
jgi:hypothetical protein